MRAWAEYLEHYDVFDDDGMTSKSFHCDVSPMLLAEDRKIL